MENKKGKKPIRNYNNHWIKGFFFCCYVEEEKSDTTFNFHLLEKEKPYRVKVKSKAGCQRTAFFLDRQTGR